MLQKWWADFRRDFFYNPKNAWIHLSDASSFFIGTSMCSFLVIVPAFVKRYSDSAILLALIPIIWEVGMSLPQLFSIFFASKRGWSHVKMYCLFETIHRFTFILVGLAILIFQSRPEILLLVFYSAFILSNFAWGFSIPHWAGTVSQTIPDSIRSDFMGKRDAIARGIGIFASLFAPVILLWADFPVSYALLFLVGGIIFTAGSVPLMFLDTVEGQVHEKKIQGNFRQFFWEGFRELFKNQKLRRYLIPFFALTVSQITLAYHTPYIIDRILPPENSEGLIGALNIVYLIATVIGSVLGGISLKKAGYKKSLILMIFWLLISLGTILLWPTLISAFLSEVFLGFFTTFMFLCVFNTIMDHIPHKNRAHVYSSFNMMKIVFVSVLVFLGSKIVDAFNYATALWAVGAASAVILIYSLFIREKD